MTAKLKKTFGRDETIILKLSDYKINCTHVHIMMKNTGSAGNFYCFALLDYDARFTLGSEQIAALGIGGAYYNRKLDVSPDTILIIYTTDTAGVSGELRISLYNDTDTVSSGWTSL